MTIVATLTEKAIQTFKDHMAAITCRGIGGGAPRVMPLEAEAEAEAEAGAEMEAEEDSAACGW